LNVDNSKRNYQKNKKEKGLAELQEANLKNLPKTSAQT